MTDSRKTIGDAVYTSLNTASYSPLTVSVKNSELVNQNSGNYISVFTKDESFELGYLGGKYERYLQVEVVIYTASNDDFNLVVSKVIERITNIENAISNVVHVIPKSIATTFEQGGSSPSFAGVLSLEIMYLTTLDDVETIIN
tara:strand:- start:4368 stop:4796 length:429 start_codon:yes stop_codon:yes gene_type:complete